MKNLPLINWTTQNESIGILVYAHSSKYQMVWTDLGEIEFSAKRHKIVTTFNELREQTDLAEALSLVLFVGI